MKNKILISVFSFVVGFFFGGSALVTSAALLTPGRDGGLLAPLDFSSLVITVASPFTISGSATSTISGSGTSTIGSSLVINGNIYPNRYGAGSSTVASSTLYELGNQVIVSSVIDYTTTSIPLVWTNNTSKSFMVTGVFGQTLSATNVTEEPSAELRRADTAELVGSLNNAISSGAVETIRSLDVQAGTIFPLPAGDTMTLTINSVATADAYTGKIIIQGIYY